MHYHTPPTPPTPSQANTTALGPLWLLVCHHIPLLHFGISFIHFSAHTFLKIFHVLSTYPPGACVPFLRHCLQPSETVWGSARRLRFFSDSRVTLIRHDDGEYGSESLETPMAFHDTGIGMDMTALVFLWAGNEYYRLGITGTRERKAKVGLRLHKNLIFFFFVLLYTLVFLLAGMQEWRTRLEVFFFSISSFVMTGILHHVTLAGFPCHGGPSFWDGASAKDRDRRQHLGRPFLVKEGKGRRSKEGTHFWVQYFFSLRHGTGRNGL